MGGLRLSWRPRAMGEPVGKSVRRDWTDLPCCVVGFSVNRGRGFTESSGAVRQGLAPRQPPQNSLSPPPGGRPGPVAHGPLHHNWPAAPQLPFSAVSRTICRADRSARRGLTLPRPPSNLEGRPGGSLRHSRPRPASRSLVLGYFSAVSRPIYQERLINELHL